MSDELKPALTDDDITDLRRTVEPQYDHAIRGMLQLGDMSQGDDAGVGYGHGPTWMECQPNGYVRVTNDDDPWYSPAIAPERIPAAVAFLNHVLPADSPYKITRADVADLRLAVENVAMLAERIADNPMTGGSSAPRIMQARADRLRALAAKLAALLPP